jgi:hypothetical protein
VRDLPGAAPLTAFNSVLGIAAHTAVAPEEAAQEGRRGVATMKANTRNWMSPEYYAWRVLHEDRSGSFGTFNKTVLPVVLRARFRRLALAGEPLE